MTYAIRYRHGTDLARRFSTIRYPWRGPGFPTREAAEEMRAAMPEPDDFEVVEDE